MSEHLVEIIYSDTEDISSPIFAELWVDGTLIKKVELNGHNDPGGFLRALENKFPRGFKFNISER